MAGSYWQRRNRGRWHGMLSPTWWCQQEVSTLHLSNLLEEQATGAAHMASFHVKSSPSFAREKSRFLTTKVAPLSNVNDMVNQYFSIRRIISGAASKNITSQHHHNAVPTALMLADCCYLLTSLRRRLWVLRGMLNFHCEHITELIEESAAQDFIPFPLVKSTINPVSLESVKEIQPCSPESWMRDGVNFLHLRPHQGRCRYSSEVEHFLSSFVSRICTSGKWPLFSFRYCIQLFIGFSLNRNSNIQYRSNLRVTACEGISAFRWCGNRSLSWHSCHCRHILCARLSWCPRNFQCTWRTAFFQLSILWNIVVDDRENKSQSLGIVFATSCLFFCFSLQHEYIMGEGAASFLQ